MLNALLALRALVSCGGATVRLPELDSFDAAHLADTKRLAQMVKDHPIMGPNMAERVAELEGQLPEEGGS